MKEIIENSGLKLKEFAEKYKIPYNTLRQWYNEERKPPIWVKELLKNKNQIDTIGTLYEYYSEEGLKYRAIIKRDSTEEQKDWFNICQKKYKEGKEGLKYRKIYLLQEYTK